MQSSSYKNFCKSYSSNDLNTKGRFDARHTYNDKNHKLKTIVEDDVTDLNLKKARNNDDFYNGWSNGNSVYHKKTKNMTKWAGMIFEKDDFKKKLNDVKYYYNAK